MFVQNDESRPACAKVVSRRTACAAGLGGLASLAGATTVRGEPGADGAVLRVPAGRPPSHVVEVRNARAVGDEQVHPTILAESLALALTTLSGESTTSEAWRTLLQPKDIVGLKFNRSAQRTIGTTFDMGSAILESLIDAGFDPNRIVCIEAPPELTDRFGTRSPRPGFDLEPTDFGSGRDELASVLHQVTAIINIPFLKHHNIAGITCALKNLSHGVVKHPARYHRNGCSPYIADINRIPLLRDKVRLHLVDGLRIVADGGPDPRGGVIANSGVLLAGRDGVAIDTVALAMLNDVRSQYDLHPIARTASDVAYLAAAHRAGLGIALPHGIRLDRLGSTD